MDFRRGEGNYSHPSFIFTSFTEPRRRRQHGDEGLLPLTYEIGQQDGQEQRGCDSGQGGTFPAAVFRRLLQLEGFSGEGVAGQQTGWRRVNGS